MMEFVVKRSEWYRGQGSTFSRLLRDEDQKKCCLGFLAQTCGYSEHEIEDKGYFNDLDDTSKIPDFFFAGEFKFRDVVKRYNSRFADEVAFINDDRNISNAQREQALTDLFATQGIQVKFED
jgi:hypothetical protein